MLRSPSASTGLFSRLLSSFTRSRSSFLESELRSASSYDTWPASYSSNSAWSKVFMPMRFERDMTSLILATSPRMKRSSINGASNMIKDLICRGEVAKIKEVMSRSNRIGMKTFDQALFELYEAGHVSYEDALRNSDSKNELRLRVKLESKRENKPVEGDSNLTIVEDEAQGRSL